MSNLKDTYAGQWSDDPALLKNLLDAGHTVIGFDLNLNPLILLSCDDEYWFETNEDRYPIKHGLGGWQFLLPAPSVEPAPLEWHDLEMGEESIAIDGNWSCYAWNDGTWSIKLSGTEIASDSEPDSNMEVAKENVHQWLVNHLNSMIKK